MPTQGLTNEQAVAVLVRILYGQQSESGVSRWSDNYYKKANANNLLKNVSMTNRGAGATRGDVGITLYDASGNINQNLIYENNFFGFQINFPSTRTTYQASYMQQDQNNLGYNTIFFGVSDMYDPSMFAITCEHPNTNPLTNPTATFLGANNYCAFFLSLSQDPLTPIESLRLSEITNNFSQYFTVLPTKPSIEIWRPGFGENITFNPDGSNDLNIHFRTNTEGLHFINLVDEVSGQAWSVSSMLSNNGLGLQWSSSQIRAIIRLRIHLPDYTWNNLGLYDQNRYKIEICVQNICKKSNAFKIPI